MSLAKVTLRFIVAGLAEPLWSFLQQVFMIGTVRTMTCLTIRYGRLVPHLLLDYIFLMALETDRVPLCAEEILIRGGMGVMAGCAFPSLQGRMYVRGAYAHLFLRMAIVADLVPFLLEDQLRDKPVPEVTGFTVSLLHHRMNVLHGRIFFFKILVTIQTVLAGRSRCLQRRTARNKECHDSEEA